MRPHLTVALGITLLATGTSRAHAEDPTPLAIGAKAPDFHLPGVDGKTHSLANYNHAKILVVYFTCNHCPTAQAYEARVQKFHDDYKDRGVALVAISPNDPLAVRLDELGYTDLGDSFDDMKIRARDHKFTYPYLYDGETQATSRAYGVLATPHVFIFDQNRILRYQGRFDDQEVKPVTRHDTIEVVEALLAGKPAPVQTTRVFGCSTKWSDKRENARQALAQWDKEPVRIESLSTEAAASLARNNTDQLLVINLWATWCGPCVQELPDLVTINRMYRGRKFKLVTISIDEPDQRDEALRVLSENKAALANFHFTGKDKDDLAAAIDKDWPGPIPHTLVIAPGGNVVYRKNGAFDPLELKRAIVEQLGRTY